MGLGILLTDDYNGIQWAYYGEVIYYSTYLQDPSEHGVL